MAELKTTRIIAIDQLEPYCAAWAELVRREPMRSPEWLLAWWSQYGGSRNELAVLIVEDGTTLVGLAPLYAEVLGRRRVYRLLGSGEVCTDHVTWFARPEHAEMVGDAVGRYFLQNLDWRRLQLEAVDVNEAAMAAALSCLERNGCLIERAPTVSCWSIDLPSTWDDFLCSLSKSHRKRCRRLCREYFETGRVKTHLAETQADFASVWSHLLELHATRWGNTSQPGGAFGRPRFRAFHEALARELLARDQLRLAWLECDGFPIAAEYQLVDERTLYAYQSGMDPGLGSWQPGNLSLIATIQYAIDRQLTTVDLLRGDEPYKAHWRAEPHARCDIRVWPGGLTDHVEKTVCSVRTLAKSWLRGG